MIGEFGGPVGPRELGLAWHLPSPQQAASLATGTHWETTSESSQSQEGFPPSGEGRTGLHGPASARNAQRDSAVVGTERFP